MIYKTTFLLGMALALTSQSLSATVPGTIVTSGASTALKGCPPGKAIRWKNVGAWEPYPNKPSTGLSVWHGLFKNQEVQARIVVSAKEPIIDGDATVTGNDCSFPGHSFDGQPFAAPYIIYGAAGK